tara:strand:+ start:559 stop:1668 length:1110 start_codon:yes stop_codon:yes gene_type:complete
MRIYKIKTKRNEKKYQIYLGNNILSELKGKVKILCPKANKVALILDTKVPKIFKKKLIKNLKNFDIFIINLKSNEKNKSLNMCHTIINKLLKNNFTRSDLVIGVGGGITGDISAFVSSIYKRGLYFINIPTTLLSQVDSSVGGKTGVNSKYGKNLIGSFFQPDFVLIDTSFLNSLPKREMICGYAEILKHSLIGDKKFFEWLKKNSQKIIQRKNLKNLLFAIYKSCKIKLSFVEKDVNEKNLRMSLNFGHTFAHAIEASNNYSNKINHGEAVLIGMNLATRISCLNNICSNKTLVQVNDIYRNNNLNTKFKKYKNINMINRLINFMKNDKKNDDKKINLILLKRIGKTTKPGEFKYSSEKLKKYLKKII